MDVSDALSGEDLAVEEQADLQALMAICSPTADILDTLREETQTDEDLSELRASIQNDKAGDNLSYSEGLIYFKCRIYVSSGSTVKHALLREHHSSPLAGHPGVDRTFRRLAASFYWKGMRKDVKDFVAACYECQTTKYSTQKPAGLLQPLPIPSQVWEDISMDFITGLPQSRGYTAIMVVVDRLSKYAHFAPLPGNFNALLVANVFIETVVKHHGFPKTLVSDRDSVFLNAVWEDMLRLSGTKLHFSTAYHPQSDGQTEVRNRGLEQYLRAFTADKPTKWVNFLPWAELSLNCFYHEGLGTSPFKALYCRDPPPLVAAPPSAVTPTDGAMTIKQRGKLIVALRKNLECTQHQMRNAANKHRRHVEYNVGDMVLLKLQQYRQYSVARPLSTKLAHRFYGPFQVIEMIGPVAYRLQLPEGSRIHNVFHVSLLRPFVEGPCRLGADLPEKAARGRPVSKPIKLLDRRTVWHDGAAVDEGLLEWSDDDGAYPTWEPITVIKRRFPDLLLGDKEVSNRGGVDTCASDQPWEIAVATREEGELFDAREVEEPTPSTPTRKSRPQRQRRPPERFGEYV